MMRTLDYLNEGYEWVIDLDKMCIRDSLKFYDRKQMRVLRQKVKEQPDPDMSQSHAKEVLRELCMVCLLYTSTLTREEQRQIIETVLSLTTGRCKVYAGVGTNCTATTIANICSFERYPLDGYLLVTPYYNRPSEEGLFRHFQAAAAVYTPGRAADI